MGDAPGEAAGGAPAEGNGMGITVRSVRTDEHERVGALTVAAYDVDRRMTEAYRRELADTASRVASGADVLVAEDEDGAVVGSVTVAFPPNEYYEHSPRHGDAGFRMLAVAPEAWGRGVGAALVDAAVSRCREAGARRLVITTMEWMATAQGMYERRGFVRRPDLDVRYPSGLGYAYALDLTPDAADRFDAPGPVPDEPPWYEDVDAECEPADVTD